MNRLPTWLRSRPLVLLLIAAGWLYSLARLFVTGIRQGLGNSYSDFLAAFPAWTVASHVGRIDMWRGSVAEEWCWGNPRLWHYGPLLHLVTLPLFSFTTLHAAYTAWLFVNILFIASTAMLAVGIIDDWKPTFATTTLVVFVLLNFTPLYEGLSQRVIEILELMLLFAAFALQRKERRFAAGFVIGLAAMTKFLPLIYLPYFVLKRNWRGLAGSVASILPIAVATELILGWRYSGIVLQLMRGSYIPGGNDQSLPSHAIALLRGRVPLADATIGRLAIILGLAAVCILYLRTRSCVDVEGLEWATLAVMMILLPPHSENYYVLLLIFAFLPAMRHYRRWPEDLRSTRAVLFGLALFLTAAPVPFSLLRPLLGANAFQRYVSSGLLFAGELLLAGLCASTLLQACRTQSTDAHATWHDR